MKAEIDALEVNVLAARAPWYRQVPVLISALALFFSFGTTAVSYYRAGQQEIHDYRTELRGLIQRLSALPKENAELYKRYNDDPLTVATLTGSVNQENTVLAKQAAELIEQIPDDVSALEYFSVSYALSSTGLYEEALRLAEEGIPRARDPVEASTLLRQAGALLFATGRAEEGRAKFRQAMDVFEEYGQESTQFAASTLAFTAMRWAQTELAAGQCLLAAQRLSEARRYVTSLGGADELGQEEQIMAVEKAVQTACGKETG